MTSPSATYLEIAQKTGAGDVEAAYQLLRPLLEATALVGAPPAEVEQAFSAFEPIARAFAGDESAELMAGVAAQPDDVKALYDAAYHLYEQKQFGIAAMLLGRANRLAPGHGRIVFELTANLEALLRYSEARLVIEASGLVGHDPYASYFGGYYALMVGDLDAAERHLPGLAEATGDLVYMREQLAGMVVRGRALLAAGVSLGEHALTAWHAVLNGALLLHESPHGYDEPMRGRYAYVSDGPERMREGLERLRDVLATAPRAPARVVAAPDRASVVLAKAAGQLLALPVVDFAADTTGHGLYVAWSLDHVGEVEFLKRISTCDPGRLLFVHASNWVDPPFQSPDVATLLYQSITHPYTGGALRVDPETRGVTQQPPDERSDDELVAEILGARAADPSVTSLDVVLAIRRALATVPAEHALGIDRTSGRRLRQRTGSPVASARFT